MTRLKFYADATAAQAIVRADGSHITGVSEMQARRQGPQAPAARPAARRQISLRMPRLRLDLRRDNRNAATSSARQVLTPIVSARSRSRSGFYRKLGSASQRQQSRNKAVGRAPHKVQIAGEGSWKMPHIIADDDRAL